jgi:hypothetical protein
MRTLNLDWRSSSSMDVHNTKCHPIGGIGHWIGYFDDAQGSMKFNFMHVKKSPGWRCARSQFIPQNTPQHWGRPACNGIHITIYYTIRQPIALLFPYAKAQLIIKQASLIHKIPQAIQFVARWSIYFENVTLTYNLHHLVLEHVGLVLSNGS